jgi:hypothetical protein
MGVAIRAARRGQAIGGRTTTRMKTRMTIILLRSARRSVRQLTERGKMRTMMTMMAIKNMKGRLALRMPGIQLRTMPKRRRRCDRTYRRASKRGSHSISLRKAAHQQTQTRTRAPQVVSPLQIKM